MRKAIEHNLALPQFPLKTWLLFHLLISSHVPEENDFFRVRVFPLLDYKSLQWRMGNYNPSSLRSAVSILRDQGLIATQTVEGKTKIRATSIGRTYVLSQFPAGRQRSTRWDDVWRVVIFAGVREKQGKYVSHEYRTIRALLSRHGFAPLERAVYLSPHPLPDELRNALIAGKKLQLVTVLETRRFVIGDEKEFASQAWNLEVKSKHYAKLGTEGEKLLAIFEKEKALTEKLKTKFLDFCAQMFLQLQQDPALPSVLLPEGYAQQRVFDLFLHITGLISGMRMKNDME